MTKVLIVDDSATIREMVAIHLSEMGFQVVEAFDGADGVEKLKSASFDLVITDVVMPNMNGYEFCRWVKNNAATKTVPVLMCTTKSEEFDKYWGMKQGADAYIVKPFKREELVSAVKKLLAPVKG
ncbi:MAG: response regulator [Pseudanabaenaceae cyanobacterium bins.68]|nr:response regulator [Pseudanabaenaceae cyanobacterium bins.68]